MLKLQKCLDIRGLNKKKGPCFRYQRKRLTTFHTKISFISIPANLFFRYSSGLTVRYRFTISSKKRVQNKRLQKKMLPLPLRRTDEKIWWKHLNSKNQTNSDRNGLTAIELDLSIIHPHGFHRSILIISPSSFSSYIRFETTRTYIITRFELWAFNSINQ